ncbi:MAG: polysaccharide deacetylase family protein [Thermoleophilaceae bacterium]|nr:polysaccharide deacetylase family protein [Thermoleophilaceae bacterium]
MSWPHGQKAALSLTFDNLAPPVITEAISPLAELLDELDLSATFFTEGFVMEEHAEPLARLEEQGHEVAYHAWEHETWHALTEHEEEKNLERGRAEGGNAGLPLFGFRPPGGRMLPSTPKHLEAHGYRYVSPAGEGAGRVGDLPALPFRWADIDAYCVLPQMQGLRERNDDPADGLSAEELEARLAARIDEVVERGGYMTLLFHPALTGWFGLDRLERTLELVKRDDLWVAPCREIAGHEDASGIPLGLDDMGWEQA